MLQHGIFIGPATHTSKCRMFGEETLTTYFYDLSLTQQNHKRGSNQQFPGLEVKTLLTETTTRVIH